MEAGGLQIMSVGPPAGIKAENPFADPGIKHEISDVSHSPSTLVSAIPPHLNHGPKKPTRKSTLTQQQKNQKRQRATQDQLGTLEVEFNRNPTPNAAVRERIAQEINMTERSVQIWFQNRRAKIKNLAKKSIETGEECDAIPESMRRYLAMQALEAGNPIASAEYLAHGGISPYSNALLMNSEAAASKVMIYHISCRSLTIGTWRRVGQTQLDLVIFYSPTKSMVTYYIQAENVGFRIEYPFSSIKSIAMEGGEHASEAEASDQGSIVVELIRPPLFTMDQGSQGWFQCRDFTEDMQASKIMVHHLGGHPKVMSNQLQKLTSLDSFKNRFNTPDVKPALASPMPLLEHRPSSQPNHTVHPHTGVFHDPSFHMGPPPPRGHKRQRSRSVPASIDFGPRRPVPPFMVHQHHHVHHHSTVQTINNQQNHIFAPVPQYAQHMPYHPPAFGPPPQQPHDQPPGFNFDFHVPAPPSATTGTTPPSSDYEHSLYPPPFAQEAYSAPITQAPFTGHYLSPVIDSPAIQDSVGSPNSVNGQPHHLTTSPHNPLFRSVSADPRAPLNHQNAFLPEFFTINGDGFGPDGRMNGFDEAKLDGSFHDGHWPEDRSALGALLVDDPLLDPQTKQPLSLPFRLSLPDQPPGFMPVGTPPPQDDYEFSELVRLEPLTPEQEKATVAA